MEDIGEILCPLHYLFIEWISVKCPMMLVAGDDSLIALKDYSPLQKVTGIDVSYILIIQKFHYLRSKLTRSSYLAIDHLIALGQGDIVSQINEE